MNDLSKVREGMAVFNAAGKKLGKVKEVKMGDPDAVTPEGQYEGGSDFRTVVADIFRHDKKMDEERAQRLMRVGYLEVDGTGIGNHFYEEADTVERVDDDGVHLNIIHK
ncbi:hypothetical protein [Arthrobacter subterraneus]|uniref:hypothetical protein n=1 Tax=Arthrobacter subterraneus TaxID=335973 RepID=UPI00382F9C7D